MQRATKIPADVSDEELRVWWDFINRQIPIFDAAIIAETGGLHKPTEEKVAFLELDNQMLDTRIADIVDKFNATKRWSARGESEWMQLLHRAVSAQGTLLALRENRRFLHPSAPAMPDPHDEARFTTWLLIDLWRFAGQAYIKSLSDAWLGGARGQQSPLEGH